MADYTTYPNGEPIARAGGANAAGFPMYTVWEVTLDLAERNLAAADTISSLMSIPANTIIDHAVMEVITALPATTTISIGVNGGTADDPDGLFAIQATSTAGTFLGAGALVAVGAAHFDTLGYDVDLLLNTAAASTGKIKVMLSGVCFG